MEQEKNLEYYMNLDWTLIEGTDLDFNGNPYYYVEIKEIQLTPQIGEHDLQVKVKAAIKFLEDGNKIKVGVRYKGRQLAHVEVGEAVLNRFIELIGEAGNVDKAPQLEGRWLNAIISSKIKK